ncbi:MAG: hypothetical protein NTZ72_18190 [Afipia sp.]|jgi:hypothetical protein|nr:hypothetical protein [Afipia sp.]
MNVIAFRKPQIGRWTESELRALGEALDIGRRGQGWDVGLTDQGDAQFYLLGPDQACTLCVSRIGGLYILEDGEGTLLFEHKSLQCVAIHAQRVLRRTRWPLVARVVMVWCAIRHMINDRVEPVLLEGEELLAHIAPQLAAYV